MIEHLPDEIKQFSQYFILYQSEEELACINEDFNALNEDLADVPELFQKSNGNPEISFVFASEDPNHLPFSGIFRQSTSIDNISSQFSEDNKEVIKCKVLGGSDAYFPDSYVNI